MENNLAQLKVMGKSSCALGKNLLRFRHNPFEGCEKMSYFANENKKQHQPIVDKRTRQAMFNPLKK